jgi:DNA polymerase-3 subunit gamma/tau
VDDVREIIEAVRYAAVSARYKVYIIDEVHMLSKNAFNALLKTLEEPPAHVKFLFATTEIQKVPITVLSRCQRFDLKRIPAERLAQHFAEVVAKEGVEAEEEALALIARAAEGSVRDGLSILDQAIAHGHDAVTALQVREMLGLSDRSAIRDLFALVLSGDAPGTLNALRAQYDLGTEPSAVFRALLELVHGITRAKVTGGQPSGSSAEEREALSEWAGAMGFAALHRLWQLLLKGLEEVHSAPVPMEAGEMALLRVIHAAGMPDPGELVRRLNEESESPPAPRADAARQSAPPAETAVVLTPSVSDFPSDFRSFVAFVEDKGEHRLAHHLHDDVGVIRYAPPELVLKAESPHLADLPRNLSGLLKQWTKVSWLVSYGYGAAEPSLREQERMAEERARAEILAHPMVKAATDAFPEAELVSYSGASIGKA